VDGACYSCDKKCLTCYGPNDDQCYTCAENTITGLGYYYYGFKCMSDCPPGFYPDNFEKSCKPCKTVCSACTSWDFCTACIEGPYQLNNGECTFFQCMESQYRAVKPTLACYDCDPSCLTCQGMSRFDCVTCKPAYLFAENSCLTCRDQPGLTESPDPNNQGCVEICGDGFNFGMVQCDDGNLMNGDGCNSKCFIEKGWNCSGGSPYIPDTCKDI
jgi:proprotein convertase subtilisin/kexin type 5